MVLRASAKVTRRGLDVAAGAPVVPGAVVPGAAAAAVVGVAASAWMGASQGCSYDWVRG